LCARLRGHILGAVPSASLRGTCGRPVGLAELRADPVLPLAVEAGDITLAVTTQPAAARARLGPLAPQAQLFLSRFVTTKGPSPNRGLTAMFIPLQSGSGQRTLRQPRES